MPDCRTAQAQQAESETGGLRTWEKLYAWYKNFRLCDDGGIAEAYSEDVARVLVDH